MTKTKIIAAPELYAATVERALVQADSVISKLLSAYEANDMAAIQRMLGAMSRRRAETSHKTAAPLALH